MLSQPTSDCEVIAEPRTQPAFKTFRIVLIKPSKYDDEGYVIRFWKGVLPSNTLNVLHGLTEAVKDSGVFGDLPIEIVTFDETAESLPVRKIIRWSRRPSTKLVVGLVGVQTNQFPRAFDLARQFRAAGIDVIIGGFHTSGTINMLSDQEPDIQALVKESIQEAQRIQGEIWHALKIAEWQKAYGNARSMLPGKVKALLDPFEELSSKILFTGKDLDAFLRQWQGLQLRLQEMRRYLIRDGEAARGWLDEMVRMQRSIRLGDRIQEWQEAYSRLRHSLPSKYSLVHAKFDALNNRALYSREPLQQFWNNTLEQLKGMRLWNIHPGKLTASLIKDLFLTTSFAFTFRAGSRAE